MAHKTRTDHKKDLIRKTFLSESGKELLDIWKKEFIDVSAFDESEALMVRAITNKDFVQAILNALETQSARATIAVAVDNTKKS